LFCPFMFCPFVFCPFVFCPLQATVGCKKTRSGQRVFREHAHFPATSKPCLNPPRSRFDDRDLTIEI
jgi:hypothetical protein